MGHSELLALNIDEGSRKDPGGRRLDIEVIKAGEARAEAAAAGDDVKEERRVSRKQSELDGDQEVIVEEIKELKEPETKTGIRDESTIPPVRFNKAWASLTKDKTIVLFGTIREGNNQPHDGYCLAGQEKEFRTRQMSSDAVSTGSDECVDAVVVSPSIRGLTDTASITASCEATDDGKKADGCRPWAKRQRGKAKPAGGAA